MEQGTTWLSKQVNGYGYKDKRLGQRMEKVLAQLSISDLSKGFPAIFTNKHALKAFYSLMNHEQTSHTALFNCYRQNLNLQAGQRYWVVQDTTSLNFTGQEQKAGMGYLSELSQRGLWLHHGLILSATGVPEGLLCQQVIIRHDADYGKKAQRAKRPFAEKESYKWARALSCSQQVATAYNCSFIHIMDREADVLEVMRKAWDEKQHFLIRARHDRLLPGADEQVKRLTAHLQACEPVKLDLELPGHQGKLEKHTCALKWQVFEVEGQPLSVVQLQSVTVPELEWVLLSDLEVKDAKDALELVQAYKLRWRVEELHKGLKTGCNVEKRQFSSLPATLNSIALLTLMALWLLRVKVLAQTNTEEDIRPTLSAAEQQVLRILAGQHLRPLQRQQLREFTAQWLAVLLGNMGGFVGNYQHQMPGWQTLWLGYTRYQAFLQAFSHGVNATNTMG